MRQHNSTHLFPSRSSATGAAEAAPEGGVLIVGIDGRPQDADALALARVLAAGMGGGLVCAHALSNMIGGRGMADYERTLELEAQALVGAVARELGAEPELLRGENHARALAHLAERRSAKLLVLGSTHRGEVGRVVPGGVASQLLTKAPCGVAVAPAGYAERPVRPVKLIGVAYDGTTESIGAAEAAVEFATRVDASVRLYHAFHEVPDGPSWDAFRDHMREFAQGIVDRGLDRLQDGVPADGRALEGPPGEAITHAAEADGVDLLFVGSRGYGPLREALVGGLVGALLSSVSCPLIILPRHALERADQ